MAVAQNVPTQRSGFPSGNTFWSAKKEPRLEQFVRQANGEWTLKEAAGLNAEIQLNSLGIALRLAEVFAKVQFAPARLRVS